MSKHNSNNTIALDSKKTPPRIKDIGKIDPLTDNQAKFFEAYNRGDYFIMLNGSAGTGKSFSRYDQFKLDNPHLERYIDSAPRIAYDGAVSLDKRTDNTWKEVLQKIGEQDPGSPLAERYNKKSAKTVATEQVLDKHIKKQQEAKKKK